MAGKHLDTELSLRAHPPPQSLPLASSKDVLGFVLRFRLSTNTTEDRMASERAYLAHLFLEHMRILRLGWGRKCVSV